MHKIRLITFELTCFVSHLRAHAPTCLTGFLGFPYALVSFIDKALILLIFFEIDLNLSLDFCLLIFRNSQPPGHLFSK